MALKDIPKYQRRNVRILRKQPLAEISGALGDLGTLLPLMIALALQGSISLPSTLVFSGLFNIVTGIVFGIPLPVQPMKAIAAAAIASHASERDTLAAGALVASAVLILSATGLLRLLTVYIPVPVVKGIQFGAGLSLVISAGTGMLGSLGWAHNPFDNRIWALAAFLLLIFTSRTPKRFPYALIVFVVGLILSIVAIVVTTSKGDGSKHGRHLPGWEIWHPSTIIPAWGSGEAWSMAVAQLPLTTLNSVIAAAALASDLMGPGSSSSLPGQTPTVTELGLSVAAMNLLGCWFGAMPVCHGAGGLAAQHRFGARSGSSIILLGAFKLLLGLFLGTTLLDVLGAFPKSILGIMVVAAGLELAKVGQSLNHGAPDLWEDSVSSSSTTRGASSSNTSSSSSRARSSRSRQLPTNTSTSSNKKQREVSDEERQERWAVMLMTTAGILAFKNDAVGFVAGMLTYWAYRLSHAIERRRESRRSGERQPLLRWP